jgi:1-phosphofructokinase family hexose kinase
MRVIDYLLREIKAQTGPETKAGFVALRVVVRVGDMIVAAGLTPAWQKTLVFDGLVSGEVNRAVDVQACAAGKPVNVAVAVQSLGGASTLVVPLGGPTGEAMLRDLGALGVKCEGVPVSSPTRVCSTLVDQRSGTVTELVENAGALTEADLAAFGSAYERAAQGAELGVLSGSLPDGTPASFYRDLMARASCRVVLDARGEELLSALALKPLVVKPNRRELEQTLGRHLDSDALLVAAMRELGERGAEWVVVSHGPDALFAWGERQLYRFDPAPVPVLSAIGSGDCLAAGMAWALERGMTMPDAIRSGLAAAADNATRLLPARLDPERVTELRGEVKVESRVTAPEIASDDALEAAWTRPAPRLPTMARSAEGARRRRLCFVGSDIFSECTVAAHRMGDALGGQGKVALIGALDRPGSEAALRNDVFAVQLGRHYPGIEVVARVGCSADELRGTAESITRQLLRTESELAGIYANSEHALGGIVAALEDAGLDGGICVVGPGNQPELMEFVRDGHVTFALLEHRFAYGYDSIVYLYNQAVAGQTPPTERVLHVPALISRDNWADYWAPETGYLLTDGMKRGLARPVPETPMGPLRFALLLEGSESSILPVMLGAREAQKILADTEVSIHHWSLDGLSREQADARRMEEFDQAERAGCHGVALAAPNATILPRVEAAADRGVQIVLFHTEPADFGPIGGDLGEVLASLSRQLRLRERAEQQLASLSQEDDLTGLFNRSRFNQYGALEWRVLLREASDQDVSVALVMLEIDGFQQVSETHGHLIGDECLRVVGERIQDCLYRPKDFAARYAAHQFAVVLPGTNLQGALGVAERMRRSVERSVVSTHGHTVNLTVSAGVGSLNLGPADNQDSWARLITQAEEALERARNNGHNRVEAAC